MHAEFKLQYISSFPCQNWTTMHGFLISHIFTMSQTCLGNKCYWIPMVKKFKKRVKGEVTWIFDAMGIETIFSPYLKLICPNTWGHHLLHNARENPGCSTVSIHISFKEAFLGHICVLSVWFEITWHWKLYRAFYDHLQGFFVQLCYSFVNKLTLRKKKS